MQTLIIIEPPPPRPHSEGATPELSRTNAVSLSICGLREPLVSRKICNKTLPNDGGCKPAGRCRLLVICRLGRQILAPHRRSSSGATDLLRPPLQVARGLSSPVMTWELTTSLTVIHISFRYFPNFHFFFNRSEIYISKTKLKSSVKCSELSP